MKKLNSVIRVLFSTAWKRYPRFFLLEGLKTLIETARPFLGIFITPLLVDELCTSRNLRTLALYAGILVVGECILQVVNDRLNMTLQKYQERLDNYFTMQISLHSMGLDFQLTEDKAALDQLEKARTGMTWYSGGAYGIAEQLFMFLGNIFKIAGFVTVITLHAPLLLAVILVQVALNGVATARQNKVELEAYGRLSKVNRLFGYFGWGIVDFRFGKDIRLYDARRMLVNKWKGYTKDLYFSIQYAEDNSPCLLVTTKVITDTNETINAFVYYYDEKQKNIELLTYLASNGTADPIKIKDGEFVINTHHSLRIYNWASDGDKSEINASEIYGYFIEKEKYTYTLLKWQVPFYNRKIRLDARKSYSKDKIDTYAYDTATEENFPSVKASYLYDKYANANPVPFYNNTEESWNKFYNDASFRGNIHAVTWHGDDSNSSIIMDIVNELSYQDFIKAEEQSSIPVNSSRLSYCGKFSNI